MASITSLISIFKGLLDRQDPPDLLDQLDPMDLKDSRARVENRVDLAIPVFQVNEVCLAFRENLDPSASRETLVLLDLSDRRDPKEAEVTMENMGHRALQVCQVHKVSADLLELPGNPEQLVLQVKMEKMAHPGPLDLPELLELVGLVVNVDHAAKVEKTEKMVNLEHLDPLEIAAQRENLERLDLLVLWAQLVLLEFKEKWVLLDQRVLKAFPVREDTMDTQVQQVL
jgi:hypothetical protein